MVGYVLMNCGSSGYLNSENKQVYQKLQPIAGFFSIFFAVCHFILNLLIHIPVDENHP